MVHCSFGRPTVPSTWPTAQVGRSAKTEERTAYELHCLRPPNKANLEFCDQQFKCLFLAPVVHIFFFLNIIAFQDKNKLKRKMQYWRGATISTPVFKVSFVSLKGKIVDFQKKRGCVFCLEEWT